MFRTLLRLALGGGLVWITVLTGCGSPQTGTGTRIADGVGIRDYYTVRAADDGRVVSRDISPEPRPREAITGDDYFQLKLEHIYIGDVLQREHGNVAIISQVEGILPDTIMCRTLDLGELGVDLDQRESSNLARGGCAYKHVITINPVFQNGHVTFDSAFITPPFRMGTRPVGLRFIIAQLNDYELARSLVNWIEDQTQNLSSLGLAELTDWQSRLVNIGFTGVNMLLDYASMPSHVFEFETDFVPIEVVGGVTTPQNLFMGGDFVIVGFPAEDGGASGALQAAESLVFNSGRLYWRHDNSEYRGGAYIVFKVVRESRFPGELPVTVARLNREFQRDVPPDEVVGLWRDAVLTLQDARVVNETEGRYLLDVFDWLGDARETQVVLDALENDGERRDPEDWPAQMRALDVVLGTDLSLLADLDSARTLLDRLGNRIYDNYERNPGLWQAECVAFRSMTQNLADHYNALRPLAERAFEDLQIARMNCQRGSSCPYELSSLESVEIWAQGRIEALPESLDEPACPGLRR